MRKLSAVRQVNPFPNWGRLSIRKMQRSLELVYNLHHEVWIWHRREGPVAIKRFADNVAYRHSLAIHHRVNHLPVFTRVLGQAQVDDRPALVLEAHWPDRWIDGQMPGGRRLLRSLHSDIRWSVVMGVVTGAGLLHAHGIVEDTNGFENQFFYNLVSGAVRFYDAEEWRLAEAPASLASPTYSISNFLLRCGYPDCPPDVPPPEWDAVGRPVIPGAGRYVVDVTSPQGSEGVTVERDHCIEYLRFTPRRPSRLSRRADYALFRWPADPVRTGYRSGYDIDDLMFWIILNKIRPGGIAVITAEGPHHQLNELAASVQKRGHGPAPTALVIESAVAPPGTLLIRKLRETYT